MADKQPAKKPRLVKNPETFRERAVKASETDNRPRRGSGSRRAIGTGSKTIAAPFKRVGRTRPLRLLGKVLFPSYLRDSWTELKLVTWPTWQQSRQLTFAVLVFAVVFGAIIAGVDYGLDKIFRNILLK